MNSIAAAIDTIEHDALCSEFEHYAAVQRIINAGQWGLQGSYGREMMNAIRSGRCMLGRERAHDYYGNAIPSRDDVEFGTIGSYDHVARTMGDDYADQMAAI